MPSIKCARFVGKWESMLLGLAIMIHDQWCLMCDKSALYVLVARLPEHMFGILDKAGVKHRAPSSFLNLIFTPSIDNFPT
jgi:hypothetical protein